MDIKQLSFCLLSPRQHAHPKIKRLRVSMQARSLRFLETVFDDSQIPRAHFRQMYIDGAYLNKFQPGYPEFT